MGLDVLITDEERKWAREGQLIKAIKGLMGRHPGIGLKYAKDVIQTQARVKTGRCPHCEGTGQLTKKW